MDETISEEETPSDDSSSANVSSRSGSQVNLELETVSFSGSSSSSSSSSTGSDSERSGGNAPIHRHHFAPLNVVVDTSRQAARTNKTIREARNELTLIFDRTNWYDPQGHNYVLSLLTQFPALAVETFEDSYDELRSPLSHLLAARANISIIQTVYELYPEAIAQTQGNHGDYPAHDACWYGNDSNVVKFIVLEYPEALTKRNDYRRLPIHDALRSSRVSRRGRDRRHDHDQAEHTPLETIRFLLEMYPEWLPDNDGKNYLEMAFSYGYDVETLQYIAGQWPADMDVFQCQSTGSFTLDLPRAKIIASLLPQIRTLRLDPPTWSLEGFVHLMDVLAQDDGTTVQMLEILEFPGELILQEQQAQRALQEFLETNTTVEVLIISFPRVDNLLENFCDVSLRLMERGLRKNSSLKRVVLKRMHLTNDGVLKDVLMNAAAPTSLVLEHIAFQQPIAPLASSSSPYNEKDCCAQGKIESVRFVDCTIPSSCFVNLLHRVAQMPSLKRLNIGISPTVPGASALVKTNLTDPLVQLLQQEQIEELGVSSVFEVDMEPISQLLKTNTTLHTLLLPSCKKQENLAVLEDVLANHNSTLKECAVKSAGRHDTVRNKVILWTGLNRFGRDTVRKDGATRLELWEQLCKVREDKSIKLPIDKLNLQYGLLRECPYLWCNSQALSPRRLFVSD